MFLFRLRNLLARERRVTPRRVGACRCPRLETLEERVTPSVFLVTNNGDADYPTNGSYNGTGSLRQAIVAANLNPGLDTVQFNLPEDQRTISPMTPLPTLADAVTIDGTSQPGWSFGFPRVILDGSQASFTTGLFASANGCEIRGLTIQNFGQFGVVLDSNDNTLVGNIIGSPSIQGGNNFLGVLVRGSDNHIGGLGAEDANSIVGNSRSGLVIEGQAATGNVVEGNFIAGAGAGSAGIFLAASGNTIGGTAPGSGNYIGGNGGPGIDLDSQAANNQVQGNFIGLAFYDIDPGFQAYGNRGPGVLIEGGASHNTIGGTSPGARNYIVANTGDGVELSDGEGAAVPDRTLTGNVVEGNWIGVGPDGKALANQGNGVSITSGADPNHAAVTGNTIGGTAAGALNLISGNSGYGVALSGPQTFFNVLQGNFIGTNAADTAALGNGMGGVLVHLGAVGNSIGTFTSGGGNVISGNIGNGVTVDGPAGDYIQGNQIGTDQGGFRKIPNTVGVELQDGTQFNVIQVNLISGNNDDGVWINGTGTENNFVLANTIGTNLAGTFPLANGQAGVDISGGASMNFIGGGDGSARNLISGNGGAGVLIDGTPNPGDGSQAGSNTVSGNYIGTNKSGTQALGNGDAGVFLRGGTANNTIGGTGAHTGNLISGNAKDGVKLLNAGTSGNLIQGNFIGTDTTGTVAVPNQGYGVDVGFLAGPGGGSDPTGFGPSNNLIGGTATFAGNLISGNVHAGVLLDGFGTNGNKVQGNLIGTDRSSTARLGNGFIGTQTTDGAGVFMVGGAADNLIGGSADDANRSVAANPLGLGDGNNALLAGQPGNVISANGHQGVADEGAGPPSVAGDTSNQIEGNWIGTDLTGTRALGNLGDGVDVYGGATNDRVGGQTPGAGNTIAFNLFAGVNVAIGSTSVGILQNAIHDNGTLGIDLGGDGVTDNHSPIATTGPNNFQNFPVLTSAETTLQHTVVTGSLAAAPLTTYTIEFFASPAADPLGFGEGAVYLGQIIVSTDPNGFSGSFIATVVPYNQAGVITATATDSNHNTSEFSQAIPLATFTQLSVTASATPNPVVVGDQLTTTFQVTNQSRLGTGDVVLTDALPAGVSLVSATTTQGTFTQNGNTLTFDLGPVRMSVPVTVTVVVTPTAPGDLTNTVTIHSPVPNPAPGNNSATVVTHAISRDQAFVAQLYRDLLHREGNPATDLAGWVMHLEDPNRVTRYSRAEVAQLIEGSDEYRTLAIQGLYQRLLNRPAGSTEVSMWLGSYPGQAQLEADILGSPEYFGQRGGLSNGGWLVAVYRDVLGRALDRTEAQIWLPLLPGGALSAGDDPMAARTRVALQIIQSEESDTARVDNLYEQLLGRHADTNGLTGFVGAMLPPDPQTKGGGDGEPIETVRAAIAGSDEYFARL
jgi:uncharacterized repeat protein (TIGR01451 family)